MFEDLEYRHHAKISRNAWYLKVWCWAWMSEPENADFCKLFWGVVFLGPNLFARVIGFPFWVIWQGIKTLASFLPEKEPEQPETFSELMKRQEREAREQEKAAQERRRRKKEREARVSAFFGRIGMAADRVVGAFQAGWSVLRWFVYTLTIVLALVLAGALVWGMTMLVPLVGHHIQPIVMGILIMLAVVGGLIALMVVIGSTGYFFTETEKGDAVRRTVKSGGGSFFHAMYMGLGAVKSRTCPKVELIEENK